MTTYKVEVNGNEVWSDSSSDYLGLHHFPAEYRDRPSAGLIRLSVDDVVISNAVPEGDE